MIRSKQTWMIILCCLAISPCGCKKTAHPAGDNTQYAIIKPYEREDLKVEVKISKDTIALSDLLWVELRAEMAPDYFIESPVLSESLTQFKIFDDYDPGKKLGADNKIILAHRYRLEPLTPGDCTFPELHFTFERKAQDAKEAQPNTLITEPVTIHVTMTLVPEPNMTIADITDKDIEDIEDVVEMRANYWPWLISLGIVVVIGLGIIIALRLRPKKALNVLKIYRPAHEIALEMLKKISEEKLVEQGLIKEFYEKLSFCLRQYIENRFRLRAPEQTTEEFLEELKKSDFLEPEHKEQLKKFLEHCDLVKFAKYRPDNEQINQSLTMAEQFVENTKSPTAQVEIS